MTPEHREALIERLRKAAYVLRNRSVELDEQDVIAKACSDAAHALAAPPEGTEALRKAESTMRSAAELLGYKMPRAAYSLLFDYYSGGPMTLRKWSKGDRVRVVDGSEAHGDTGEIFATSASVIWVLLDPTAEIEEGTLWPVSLDSELETPAGDR